MAIFKCKMCGGDLEIAEGVTIAECEYCGTKQTVPKAMDENLQNLFNRANTLRIKSEFDKAEKLYEKIIQADTTQSEAYWGLILCKYGIEYVDDPATYKKVPTCHRASYDSIIADDDYKSAIENADLSQRVVYEEQAREIDRIQKDILALAQKEETYDVFICYKETDADGKRTQDSVIANDIYYQLTQEGFKVFYAAVTLEGKLGSAYEPIIFAALNSAKVMLSIGTKPEYFNAVWVKNEWSRFLKIVKNDRSKLLIPCYRDMDAYELPEEFAHLQAQDMAKIGFINDIVRGIKKVISKDEQKQATVVKETVISGGNTNTAPLLKRAFMFLEDGDWNSANEYCEKVLDNDPECAQAYLGKLMVELCVKTQDSLKNCAEPFYLRNNYQKAIRFANAELKEKLEYYALDIHRFKIENDVLLKYSGSRTSITIPDSVTSIGDEAFCLCKNLTSITIPDSVTSIGECAFYGCSSLTSITVPNSVTSIGRGAFNSCKNLTSIIIPDSVTSIGDHAFVGCESLTSIKAVPGNTVYKDVNGVLFAADGTVLYLYPAGKTLGKYIIPAGVASIGVSAFNRCKNLTSITIPDSVTSIGECAFYGCSSLTSITVPNSVTSIGRGAFDGCSKLTSVTIGNSVTSIGDDAFSSCSSLTNITIPDSVTSIGEGAFDSCSKLTSVTIGNSVTSIGDGTFSFCENLASIIIPDSVTSIGEDVFYECRGLTIYCDSKSYAENYAIKNNIRFYKDERIEKYEHAVRMMGNSKTSFEYYEAAKNFEKLSTYKDSAKLAEQCIEKAEEARKDETYTGAKVLMKSAKNERDYKTAAEQFESIPTYRDSAELAKQCREKAEDMKVKAQRREAGVCQHCGGKFKGLFKKLCSECGREKDY